MEGSYCGKTGTSTGATLSLSQTGGNRLKIAGVRACRHVFPGQRHKGMSEPRRAGHLRLPSRTAGPGPAPGTHRAAPRTGPAPAPAAPINADNSIWGYGFVPPGGAAASSASSTGGAGGARPGPSTDNNNTTHNIHTALPICRGNRRDERAAALRQQEVPLRGSAASGWYPRPAGSPGPRSLPRPPGAARCARPPGLRQRLRGWLGRLPCAPHCLRADSGADACSVAACLQGCYYLSGCYLHGCHLLLARLLLPAGHARCPPPPRTAAAGTCAAVPPPLRVWTGLLNGNRTKHRRPRPLHRPPAPIGRAARPPNLDPPCHWPAARFGPAHKGAGGGRCPGRGRDAQLWCRVGWGAHAGLHPPAGLAVARGCHWPGSARAEGRGARGGEDALRARG